MKSHFSYERYTYLGTVRTFCGRIVPDDNEHIAGEYDNNVCAVCFTVYENGLPIKAIRKDQRKP